MSGNPNYGPLFRSYLRLEKMKTYISGVLWNINPRAVVLNNKETISNRIQGLNDQCVSRIATEFSLEADDNIFKCRFLIAIKFHKTQ